MNRAVIFDLDGVLADSSEWHYRAWKKIATALNLKFDRRKNDLLRGVSRRDSVMIITAGQIQLSENDITRIMNEKNEIYLDMIKKAGAKLLLPGVIEFVKGLKKDAFKTAIASGSKNARLILELCGLDKNDFFDAIVDGNEIKKSKPDPEIFLLAASKLGIKPADCIVIEDGEAGVIAAKNAGMHIMGVGPAELGKCDIRLDSLAAAKPGLIKEFFENR